MWELPRSDVAYQVRFYGHAERGWEVLVMAYDAMIPRYATENTTTLWL